MAGLYLSNQESPGFLVRLKRETEAFIFLLYYSLTYAEQLFRAEKNSDQSG